MKTAIFFICLMTMVGCSTSQIVVGTVRQEISSDDVKIYLTKPSNYEEIALLKSNNSMSWAVTEQGIADDIIKNLKTSAAKMGANGILLVGDENQNVGSVGSLNGAGTNGSFFATGLSAGIMQREMKAIAIYVEN